MANVYCKITSSNRCAKTTNMNENDPNCTFNTATNRCNKNAKKVSKVINHVKPKLSKTNIVQKNFSKLGFRLSNDTKFIEFSQIPEKLYLKNTLNSAEDLDAIIQHLKLSSVKSKTLNAILEYFKLSKKESKTKKFLKIKEYISATLRQFPLEKTSFDTFELHIPSYKPVVYQYGQHKNASLYDITLLLLYLNIDEVVATIKKTMLCKIIDSKLPLDEKEIEKHFFQNMNIKNCQSLSINKIDKILSSLYVEKTKMTKTEKCSILLNIEKIYKAKKSTPYIILDNENVLFMIHPEKILYNIYDNITDLSQLSLIIHHLEKNGLVPYLSYKAPKITENNVMNYNKFIKRAILTKKNFPNYDFPVQLDKIPKTLPKTPPLPDQHFLSEHAFIKLSHKMSNTITNNQKPFASGRYRLIDLVPPENILPNGKDIRMYHGTKLLHWENIKKCGIKPVGGGTLGAGFYFTPSVRRATHYLFVNKAAQKKKLGPVLVELTIKDADKLKVGNLASNFPIKTIKMDHYWQFIAKSPSIIDKHFRIYRVFKLNF